MVLVSHFRDLLKDTTQNRALIGTWITIPSINLLDIISRSGVDFVVVDGEHSCFSENQFPHICAVVESNNVSPVYRASSVDDKGAIVKAMDAGFHAVQVPNISDRQSAERVRQMLSYPPFGSRGFSPFTRACGFSADNSESFFSKKTSKPVDIIQIEGEEALKNFDEIIEKAKPTIVFLGLFDLSVVLGVPGDVENPLVVDKFSEMIKKLQKQNILAGSISNSIAQLDMLKSIGVNYITHSADCEMILQSYLTITKNN